jgi:DNA-binding transcriptional ArsR family regulator
MNNEVQLDRVFAALSDPTRRAILARLSLGDASVSELAEPFEMAQPTISKHLTVLEKAGLIRTAKDAQRRPRSLVVGGPLEDVDAWLTPFKEQWERRLDRLDSFLVAQQKTAKNKPRAKEKK